MKPRIFIASSTDMKKVAEAFHQDLSTMADCVTWTQGAFPASSHSLDSLLNNVNDNDFGVFVFGADDDLTLRTDKPAKHFKCARDNVVFEAGLFMGRYGKHNVFIVYPDTCKTLRIPTDLDGFTRVAYSTDHPAGLSAGVGAACIKIRDAIEKFGVTRQLWWARTATPGPSPLAGTACAPVDASAPRKRTSGT